MLLQLSISIIVFQDFLHKFFPTRASKDSKIFAEPEHNFSFILISDIGVPDVIFSAGLSRIIKKDFNVFKFCCIKFTCLTLSSDFGVYPRVAAEESGFLFFS